MIVKMHKYSFLVFHADYEDFLEGMKNLGVLHIIESSNEPSDDMLQQMKQSQELERTVAYLQRIKVDKDGIPRPSISGGESVLNEVARIQVLLEQLGQQKMAVEKDIRQFEPWGSFDWSTISKLSEVGLKVLFFQCSSARFSHEWENQVALSVVSEQKGVVSYVIFRRDDQELPEMDAEEVRLPAKSLSVLMSQLEDIEQQIAASHNQLSQYAAWSIPVLTEYQGVIRDRLQTDMAVLHTEKQADGALMQLEGFVPVDRVAEVDEWLTGRGVVYLAGEADVKERPPVLLKNNAFARLFEPIGNLFSLPAYMELDLTPFFAPFFMLFFGFCFGDAGYGLLLILGGFIGKRKVDAKFKPYLSLLQWFGVATVLFGSLTGSFMGMKLTEFQWPAISSIQKMMFNDGQMFNLALILGFIQVMFGMVLKGVNQIIQDGFKYSISTWSWIVTILSFVVFYALDGMMGTLHLIILGISALGIFIFNHPQRSVFINIGAGLWDTYNMVTGVAGDVLSYIRLFALGLSGGILGYVFNRLAFDLSPDIPVVNVIVTGLILVVGHSLNIFMSALGAFVHPMRLIFVEFFKNSGFLGGGKSYSPFSKTTN